MATRNPDWGGAGGSKKRRTELTKDEKAKKKRNFIVGLASENGVSSEAFGFALSWTIAKTDIKFTSNVDKEGRIKYKPAFDGTTVLKGVHQPIKDAGMIMTCPMIVTSALTGGCGLDFEKNDQYNYLVTLAFGFATDKQMTDNFPEIIQRQEDSKKFLCETLHQSFIDYVMSNENMFKGAKDKVSDDFDKRKMEAEVALEIALSTPDQEPDADKKKKALQTAFDDEFSAAKRTAEIVKGLKRDLHYPIKMQVEVGDDKKKIIFFPMTLKTRSVMKIEQGEKNKDVPEEVLRELERDGSNPDALRIKNLYETGHFVKPLKVFDKFDKEIPHHWFRSAFRPGATVIAKIVPVIYEKSATQCGLSMFVNSINVLVDGKQGEFTHESGSNEYIAKQLAEEKRMKEEEAKAAADAAEALQTASKKKEEQEKLTAAQEKAQAVLKGLTDEQRLVYSAVAETLITELTPTKLVEIFNGSMSKQEVGTIFVQLQQLALLKKSEQGHIVLA